MSYKLILLDTICNTIFGDGFAIASHYNFHKVLAKLGAPESVLIERPRFGSIIQTGKSIIESFLIDGEFILADGCDIKFESIHSGLDANLMRWLNEYWSELKSGGATSSYDKDKLQKVAEKIRAAEARIYQELVETHKALQERVGIDDYELECEFAFLLSEDDDYFDENEDNILASITESAKGISSAPDHHGINDGENHNDFVRLAEHPMGGEFHSWIYHSLYDHIHLSLEGIARIGDILVDIKPLYQYRF